MMMSSNNSFQSLLRVLSLAAGLYGDDDIFFNHGQDQWCDSHDDDRDDKLEYPLFVRPFVSQAHFLYVDLYRDFKFVFLFI